MKSKGIHGLSRIILEEHGGKVPANMAALERMPGVGHKTASVVMAQAFGVPAFPVDTHIHRLAYRWTLSTGHNVERTEADLKRLFPEDSWNALHLRIIYFGRGECPARGHDHDACPICSWAASRAVRAAEAPEARATTERRSEARPRKAREGAPGARRGAKPAGAKNVTPAPKKAKVRAAPRPAKKS